MDLTPLLTIFNDLKADFSQYFGTLFVPLFENLNAQQIANLFNKNQLLYNLISHHFGESTNQTENGFIISNFIGAFPYFKETKNAKLAVKNVVIDRKGYKFIDSIFNGFESSLTSDASNLEPIQDLFSLFLKFFMLLNFQSIK